MGLLIDIFVVLFNRFFELHTVPVTVPAVSHSICLFDFENAFTQSKQIVLYHQV